MGVIQVEIIDADVTSNGQTLAITDVGSTSSAFIRNTGSRRMSAGPIGNTGNAGPDELSMWPELTAANQITFTRPNSINQKYIGEIWRYSGSSGGADEFISRGTFTVSLGAGAENNSVAVGAIADRNKCVCFKHGVQSTNTSNTSGWLEPMAIAYIDASNNLVVSRQDTGGALDVRVEVVEFTGSNWTVGYMRGAFASATRTLVTDSTGTGGSTFSVSDWSQAMIIENQQEGDSGTNQALEDRSHCVEPGSSNSTITTFIDAGAANNGDIFAYVVNNAGMVVNRATATKTIPNNNSYDTTLTFPGPTLTDLTEASIEFSSTSDGSGTAHARGNLAAYLNTTSQIRTWAHRSGNTGNYRYGVVNLVGVAGVAAITISNVDGDDILGNTQAGVVITGSEFEALQGTGTVILSEFADGAGTTVVQTVTNWSDTAITINFSAGALADTNSFIRVTTDGGSVGSRAVQVGVPPLTYSEIIDALSPDHFWSLNGDYIDTVQGLNWTVAGGSPSFTSNPLTRGRTQAWTVGTSSDEAGPPNSNFMNQESETTRTMGGWIRITQIQDSLVMFYEEGGGINNIAFFMGIGGILIAQMADTGDDNVHAYSDFPLEPNRSYHIAFRFDYTQPIAANRRFELFVDGVLQSSTFGNPLTSSGGHLDAHSGDIEWGGSGDNLEVFGTDINFPAATTTYFNDWATWTTYISDADMRSELFEQGVRGDIQITSDTQANMQTQLDVYASTVQPNSDCTFRIEACTDGDFALDFDNITFNAGTTLQIQYLGTDTLTANNLNGSNLEAGKISTLNGGTVDIVTPSTLTVSGLEANSEVRVFEAGTTTEVAGIESTSGSFITSLQTNSVDISILNLDFQNIKFKSVNTSTDAFVPVVQRVDRQYLNP
jgi:hypothetical protein